MVYFISFAHSERYGADHPLAKASSILKRKLGIKLGPLLNYADARTENDAEEEHLDRITTIIAVSFLVVSLFTAIAYFRMG